MTEAERVAVTSAREAIVAMTENPCFLRGSVHAAPGGFDVRLHTETGAYVVRTALDGTVMTVAEEADALG